MNRKKTAHKSQSTFVYAALIVTVIASLIAIASYVKRAVMGKTRESSDTFGSGTQYNPGSTLITDSSPGQPYGSTAAGAATTGGTSGAAW